jgi:competence protein ComEC
VIRAPIVRLPHALATAFCLGLALSLGLQLSGAPGMAAAVLAFGLVSLGLASGARAALLVAVGIALAGWWWGSSRLERLNSSVLTPFIGSSELVQAEVTGPPRRGPYAIRVPVRVRLIDRRAIGEASQLELPPTERAPPQGTLLEFVARIAAPDEPTASSTFDEASYLARRGIHTVLHADRFRVVGQRAGLGGVSDRIRSYLARTIAPGLSGERRAVVAGIVLGEDEGLERDLRDRFRASGLYHLLAVSGQNVAFIVAGVLLAAWLLGAPRMLAQIAAVAGIGCYVLAVGWQPSVARAGIAGGLTCLAWMASRPTDRWYFLLLGAAVLLAWNPYSLLEPGFQLSFAAVAAIFLLVPWLERRLTGYPVPARLTAVLAVSAGCGLATAPILWLQFGAVPILSVPANALAEPVVAPILGLGLLAALSGTVLPGPAAALAWVNGWLAAYLAWCARFIGGLPFAQIRSGAVLLGIVALVALTVLVWRVPRRRRPRAAVAAALLVALLAAVAGWTFRPGPRPLPPLSAGLRVTFLDVGQGDAALLQVPGVAVLVDEGPPDARVADRLARLGIGRLSLLVLTHPQRDHIGGAAAVLRRLSVDALLDPVQPSESPYETEALEEARTRRVRFVPARTGEVLRLGELRIVVIWPDGPGAPGEDPNQHAVVLLASYRSIDVLFTADAESDVTGRLPIPPVEVLKVAHHGSADPGLPDLLEGLRPLVAVISVGAGNDYGHPTDSTLAALAARRELHTYRTDRDGSVVVESDGRSLTVRTSGGV